METNSWITKLTANLTHINNVIIVIILTSYWDNVYHKYVSK